MRRHDLLKSGVSDFSVFLKSPKLKFSKEKEKGLKSYGRPQIGGPFSLSTHDSKPFTQENLLGKWSLVYFGFTNCPDICPAELDKVTTVLNNIRTCFFPPPPFSVVEALLNMSSRERAWRYFFTCLHFCRPSSRYSIAYRSIPEGFPPFFHWPRWRIR
jgi:SCO1/SenC